MRLVLLTGLGLEHRFVTWALLNAFAGCVDAVLIAHTPRPHWRRHFAAPMRGDQWSYVSLIHAVQIGIVTDGIHRSIPSSALNTSPRADA